MFVSPQHHEVPGQGCLPVAEGQQATTVGAVEKYPLHDLRYDANGNMTSTELDHFNGAIAGRVMEYDAENRPVFVEYMVSVW